MIKNTLIYIYICWFGLVVSAVLLVSAIISELFLPLEFQINLNIVFFLSLFAIIVFSRFYLIKAHNKLGNYFTDEKQYIQAIKHFKAALFLDPQAPDTYNNLGNSFAEQNLLDDAIMQYERALKLNPEFYEALNNMAKAELDGSDWVNAMIYFDKAYFLKRGFPVNQSGSGEFHSEFLKNDFYTSKIKLRHDIEQFEYLLGKKILPDSYKNAIQAYRHLKVEISDSATKDFLVKLTPEQKKLIETTYERNIYKEPVEKFDNDVINPELALYLISEDYKKNKPGFTYFDNFLTDEVLNALRNFCLNSTIWHSYRRSQGYLAAYQDDGFNCFLLYQIANEIKEKLPEIFRNLPLINMWAFKYDSHLSGVVAHADESVINLNFWITPDEANLDPESGGMVVYDQEAPPDWDFSEYNRNTTLIHEFLEKNNAKKFTVPYRQNRAVIFNSNLFHQSDSFNFRDGYENRRINITMLFGLKRE
jgi:tetratricopeptide (TPR) repeat protein